MATLCLLLAACEPEGGRRAKTAPPPAATAPTLTQAAPALPVVRAPAPAVPQEDPVEGMLRDAEKDYQIGQSEYQAGHMATARAAFDRAVSRLMAGPVEIRSDARLMSEFNRIIEGVNQLEMQAMQSGDGFAEPKDEPAPIDEANEATFPVDPAMRATAESVLRQTRSDLPLVMNDYVAGYINFYTTRARGTLVRGWQRAGRYESMVRRIFAEEGIPRDLFYLAQAESGFVPYAVSRVGARGMWQFMHYTAPLYGLKKNWWVDDRQDPEKSTRAAARYLKDLYNQFGDWYLAMAAYNTGATNVQRGVQRTGYADFWELYRRNVLPDQTKNYVPIIVAMTIIAKNPAQFGLEGVQPDPPLTPDVVPVDYAVDLRLAAEAVDTPLQQIAELNPSLIRMVTPRDAAYDLKLPPGTGSQFQAAMDAIPVEKRVMWRFHRVAAGDTLAAVAKKYKTSARAIREVNNLEGDELEPESKLIIPAASSRAAVASGAYAKRPSRYTVRKGDTVLSVADDFGVPPDKVRKWNRLKGNALRPGRTLLIYKPVSAGQPEPPPAKSHSKKKPVKKTAK